MGKEEKEKERETQRHRESESERQTEMEREMEEEGVGGWVAEEAYQQTDREPLCRQTRNVIYC